MRLSFRVKILALLAGMLLGSFALYLWMGTSLIVRDKSSYIYDFNLGLAKGVAENLSEKIRELKSISGVLGSGLELAPVPGNFLSQFIENNKSLLPESGLMIFPAKNPTEWGDPVFFGPTGPPGQPKTSVLPEKWKNQGLRPLDFEKVPVLFGKFTGDKLPISLRSLDTRGNPAVVFSLLKIDEGTLKDDVSQTRIEILSEQRSQGGEGIKIDSIPAGNYSGPDWEKLKSEILSKPFSTGVEEETLSGEPVLISYARVPDTRLCVLGLTPKHQAFLAAEDLVTQSVKLAIGILSIAVTFSLLFARGVTRRLNFLWLATQRIGSGDLNTRIPVKNPGDEITDLATSFNSMAGQIQTLVQQTAEKARMQSELEMAQTVQSQFFPPKPYLGKTIQLSGNSVPATECAGDWWQYAEIGPYLIMAIGDVTGHGVSSALVTAAAHGSFSLVMEEFRVRLVKNPQEPPSLLELFQKLNTSVWSASHGASTMTVNLSLIDTRTGQMSLINGSHPAAYVHRPGYADDPRKSFLILNVEKSDPLGYTETTRGTTHELQLEPGDLVVWYTDGLIECENSAGKRVKKLELLKKIADLHTLEHSSTTSSSNSSHAFDVATRCSFFMKQFREFLGEKAKNPDDDITIVMASVSQGLAGIDAQADPQAGTTTRQGAA